MKKQEITSIEYKGRLYPTIDLYIWKYKSWRKISVESLSDAISPDGSFEFEDDDDEGWYIDQSLFFYVPDTMIYGKKIDIMRYINMHI